MDKAVRWAISSAKMTDEPSLTAFLLPWWSSTAYIKWMQDPLVHKLARVNKKHFRFKKPDHWRTCHVYADQPKWDINFFVVANAAGLATYVKADQLVTQFSDAILEVGGTLYTVSPRG